MRRPDLLTTNAKVHRLLAAEQLVGQAVNSNDKTLIKQAKRVYKLHKAQGSTKENDSFTGSDLVDWLVFELVSNQRLRESLSQQKGELNIQLPNSLKERHKAVAVGRLLVEHEIVAALDGEYSLVDSEKLLYQLCHLREYESRGEIALRIGWAQETTLQADTLRADLAAMRASDLRKRATKEGVSRTRLGNVDVHIAKVLGLTDKQEIAAEERRALVELLVDHQTLRMGATGERVWQPFEWTDATRASTAKPRSRLALVPVFAGGAAIGALGLYVIFLFAHNLSPHSAGEWAVTALLALCLKFIALDPLMIVFETALLQCLEAIPATRRVIEASIYAHQQAKPTVAMGSRG